MSEAGEKNPHRNQFITKLADRQFASIQQTDDETGKTYEVKVAIIKNVVDDKE